MSRELPILFNTDMVRAVLEGEKTATRRAIRPRYQKNESGFEVAMNKATGQRWIYTVDDEGFMRRKIVPPCLPNDILYVRESFCPDYFDEGLAGYRGDGLWKNRNAYKADYRKWIVGDTVPEPKWTPSIHMPKEAARIWLKVTDVRVERLQEMTLDDFLSEGVILRPEAFNDPENAYTQAKYEFIPIWGSTLSKGQQALYAWDKNPWVWAIEFERCRKPE